MRISDWSSDVCSSDLSAASLGLLPERNDVAGQALEIGFGQRQRRHPHMRIEFLRVFRIGKDVIGPQPLPGVIELRSRQPTLPLPLMMTRNEAPKFTKRQLSHRHIAASRFEGAFRPQTPLPTKPG